MSKNSEWVKVMVRVRPMNKSEISKNWKSIWDVDTNYNQILLSKPESSEISKTFSYDAVYGINSTQQLVY